MAAATRALSLHVKTWIVAGPTASGKTDAALRLAERCGGEIIGADAFQVYAGLDLLTAKPTAAERACVPHHLIGTVPLAQSFDVAQYLAATQAAIAAIRARGRQSIVVGGTGLYLRALLYGLADLPPADEALRAELALRPAPDLRADLLQRDPAAATLVDLQNPRRVVRALEVCLLTGHPFTSFRAQWEAPPRADFTGVVLQRDRAELYRRIDARVERMFAEGVVEEVRAAGELSLTASQVLGWREIQALIAGRISRAECIAAIQQGTRHYAKRQLTWFRRETALRPVDAERELGLEHFA